MKLLQGDCLEKMQELPNQSIDLILCDLPYGTTACKWDTIIPFEPLWKEYKRIIKDSGAMLLFGNQPFTSLLIASNIKDFKYTYMWLKNKKTGFLNAKKQPLRQYEDIVIFYDKQCTFNPQMTVGHKPVNSYTKHTSDGATMGKTKQGISGGGSTERYPTNVLEFAVVNNDGSSLEGRKIHPTQKPVALFEYLIKTYTNEEELVLDNCMGSGTTGIACLNTNRNFIGIEKDSTYFELASKRIKEHQQTLGNSKDAAQD